MLDHYRPNIPQLNVNDIDCSMGIVSCSEEKFDATSKRKKTVFLLGMAIPLRKLYQERGATNW